MNLLEQLQNAGIPYTENEPMSRRTTFGIGGPALLLHPRTRTQLQTAVSLCRAAGTDPFILGRGSNLLVSDSGIARPVIQLDGDFTAISRQGNTLRCGAGASLIATCRAAAENSLSGLEWGFGIPGSLGGGVYMNAGAYGGELRDVLTEVTFLDEAGDTAPCLPRRWNFPTATASLRSVRAASSWKRCWPLPPARKPPSARPWRTTCPAAGKSSPWNTAAPAPPLSGR